MNKTLIIILLLIVIAIAGGFIAYQYWPKAQPVVNNQPPISDETANWKIFKNDKYGFEFKYPSNFEIVDQYDFAKNNFFVKTAYAFDDLTCGAIYEVILHDPSLPKVKLIGPDNQIPGLSFEIMPGNCRLIRDLNKAMYTKGPDLPEEANQVLSELKNQGVSDGQLTWALFDFAVESSGKFSCKRIEIKNINGGFWIDSIDCNRWGDDVGNPARNASLVPQKNEGYVAEFTDWASKYGNVFGKMLSTFRFYR